jgi:hypothetical protein
MAGVKIVLRKRPNKAGEYPLAIRITKDRKSTYVYLGQYIKKSEWDKVQSRVKRNHANSTRLNQLLLKSLTKVNDVIIALESTGKPYTLQRIRRKLDLNSSAKSFFAFAKEHFKILEEGGKYNRLGAEKPAINHLRTYLNGDDIAFHDLSVSKLEGYKAYLKGGRKVSERTAINYLIVIRTIYNAAIKEGLAKREYYPFGAGGIKIKIPESLKIALDKDEIEKIENYSPKKDTNVFHAKNIWLTSFYFAGMRASDLLRLRWRDIQKDRLHYTMSKNDKPGSIAIPQKALSL